MSPTYAGDKPVVLLGAGGHAKVLLSLVNALGLNVIGVCDPQLATGSIKEWRGIPVLGADDALDNIDPATCRLINGLGHMPHQNNRRRLYESCRSKGFIFSTLIHPSAWLDDDAAVSEGVQIMAGAIIQADSHIGANSIINTKVSIDHDCVIGSHVHLAPGVTLCGGVRVGEGTFIGAGTTIIQGVRIGSDAMTGAGICVRKDIADRETAITHHTLQS